jgi:uncharacterized membrane protein
MIESVTNKVTDSLKGTLLEPHGNVNVNTGERVVSIAAGAFVFYKALTGVFKHPIFALQEAAVGGYLLYRGATGYCPIYSKIGKDTTDPEAITITERFVVNSPRDKVFSFWRELENLPKFMKHLDSVESIDDKVSHWKANIPGEIVKVSWNAEITREEDDGYIGWQSVAGSQIDNAGKIEFKDSLNGSGTELLVEISYFPPAGVVGQSIAKLFNRVFENLVREDIIRFKNYVEEQEYKSYGMTTGV